LTASRPAKRGAVLVKKILLLKANPQVGIVLNGGAVVGGVGRPIRVHDFAEDDIGILAADIGIKRHRLQHAV